MSIPSALNDLSDVVLTSPTLDQVLKYDGTNWVNGTGGSSGTPYSSAFCFTFTDQNTSFNNPNSVLDNPGTGSVYPQFLTGYPGVNVATFVSSESVSPGSPDFAMDTSNLTALSNRYLVVCNKPGTYEIQFTTSSVNPSNNSYCNLYTTTGNNYTFVLSRSMFTPASTTSYNQAPFSSIFTFTTIG